MSVHDAFLFGRLLLCLSTAIEHEDPPERAFVDLSIDDCARRSGRPDAISAPVLLSVDLPCGALRNAYK